MTKSGSNLVHGGMYEYFQNEALNANDANLKAVGEGRPVMRRNVYGATVGGPLRKNKAFFFVSYQGTREANGATDQSLYKSVMIAPGLTDDRSAATLMNTFGVSSIDPISLKLLDQKLPNGRFLIPTPQNSGRPGYRHCGFYLSRRAVQYWPRLSRRYERLIERQILLRSRSTLQRARWIEFWHARQPAWLRHKDND